MKKVVLLLFFINLTVSGQINDLKGNVKSLRVKVLVKDETPETEYYIDENGNEIKRTYKKVHEYILDLGPYGELFNLKYLKNSYYKSWIENASPRFVNFYLKLSKSRKPVDEIWYGYTNSDIRRHYYYEYYQNDSLKYEIDKHYKPYDTIKYFYNEFGKEKVIYVHHSSDDKREVDSSKTFYDKKGFVKYAMSYDKYPNPTILEHKTTDETNIVSYFGLRQMLFKLLFGKQIVNQNYFYLIRTFDKKNRLISIINYYKDNKNIIPRNQILIKYNDENNIIEKKNINFYDGFGINTTNYNFENKLLTSIYYLGSSNYSSRQFFQYYDNKLVKRIESYSPTDIRIANFEYEIDRKGNWTKMTMTLYFNGVESKHIMKRKIKYYN
jgi:hypothetical protein